MADVCGTVGAAEKGACQGRGRRVVKKCRALARKCISETICHSMLAITFESSPGNEAPTGPPVSDDGGDRDPVHRHPGEGPAPPDDASPTPESADIPCTTGVGPRRAPAHLPDQGDARA